jgi:hypothetical protein
MGKNCNLLLEDFVAGVLQLVVQCDVEEYELRAIRKISRKHTRMERIQKPERRHLRENENRRPTHP